MVNTSSKTAVEELQGFIASNPDAREMRKALALKLMYQDYSYEAISQILDVSTGSISGWKQAYEREGLPGLRLKHKGRISYLNREQREAVLQWLQTKDRWELGELEYHLAEQYDVVYESKQSYYDLFEAAGISWKKTTKVNPKADPQAVAKKKTEIRRLLARYREQIETRTMRVLMLDECHLLWGDLNGYVWGRTDEAIGVSVVNERQKQTYYGAVDYLSGEVLIQAFDAGNSENTVSYLRYLQQQSPNQRLLVLWDGASYHRSEVVRQFLAQLNEEKPEQEWQIHCVCFAPHCPQQNPIEDIWLATKTWVRRFCGLAQSFTRLKWLFEWFVQNTTFDFPKLHMYGEFSEIK